MILIDVHETDDIKKGIPGARVVKLDFGDFTFDGNGPQGPVSVGVERKAVVDLIASMQSGRLAAHQLPGMVRSYDHIYLLIEGIYKRDADGMLMILKGYKLWWRLDIKVDALDNFVNSMVMAFGVIPMYTRGWKDTCLTVAARARWWAAPWSSHASHHGMDHFDSEARGGLAGALDHVYPPSLVTRMAYQLPGIGREKANATGDTFKTPKEMCDANEEDWRRIEGIGRKLAGRMVEETQGRGKMAR